MKIYFLFLVLLSSALNAMLPEEDTGYAKNLNSDDETHNALEESAADFSNWDTLPNELKMRILYYAVETNFLKSCGHLASINKQFRCVMADPYFVRLLAKDHVKNNEKRAHQKFWDALESRDSKTVKALVSGGIDSNTTADNIVNIFNQMLPLCFTICQNSTKMTRLLITLGANINAQEGRFGFTPFHYALSRIAYLQEGSKPLDLLTSSTWKYTVDNLTVLAEHPELFLEIRDNKGRTPLEIAAEYDLFKFEDVNHILMNCLERKQE